MILTIPNILTLLRILLVPWMTHALLCRDFDRVLFLFGIAGITDALDGFIARRFRMTSRLGSFLDPAADKVLVVVTVLTAATLGLIPWWLSLLVAGRDILIVTGVAVWYLRAGEMTMEPSLSSKLNMVIQVVVIFLVIASAGGHLEITPVRPLLFTISVAAATVSGGEYILVWGGRYQTIRRRREG
ncbi:MAG: CDP-alcohol phosphatidyltransferase family protein [Desulfuromonadia bacterium]